MELAVEGYTTREVADVLGLPTAKILAWTRSGLLSPTRGPGGAYVYCFQDIVLLRTARGLMDAEVPSRKVRRALETIRRQLPTGRPLSAVQVSAIGDRVLVRDEGTTWDPDSGQLVMDIVADPGHPRTSAARLPSSPDLGERLNSADECYDRGVDLEAEAPSQAELAYQRALELQPRHSEAHLNLGRLLHERGDLAGALKHYAAAVDIDPTSARARYNLGVVLEDLACPDEAVQAYLAALDLDDHLATAHFNLARLLEKRGRETDALQHLLAYKRLLDIAEAGA